MTAVDKARLECLKTEVSHSTPLAWGPPKIERGAHPLSTAEDLSHSALSAALPSLLGFLDSLIILIIVRSSSNSFSIEEQKSPSCEHSPLVVSRTSLGSIHATDRSSLRRGRQRSKAPTPFPFCGPHAVLGSHFAPLLPSFPLVRSTSACRQRRRRHSALFGAEREEEGCGGGGRRKAIEMSLCSGQRSEN